VIVRPDNIVRRRHQVGFLASLGPQHIDVMAVADIRLLQTLPHPLGKRRSLIDRVLVRQLDIVKHMVGAVAHGDLFCDIPVRVDHFIRAVPEKEFGVDIPVGLADHIFASQLLDQTGYL